MKEFGALADLAHHMMSSAVADLEGIKEGLEKAAELLEREAKEEFGIYQEGAGPFPAWASLAEATKADRTSKGFTPDDPLLRTGGLRGSIKHEVDHLEAAIGSEDPVMLWQELGTHVIPPRPVLGIALMRNIDKVQAIIGQFAARGLAGGGVIEGGDYEV